MLHTIHRLSLLFVIAVLSTSLCGCYASGKLYEPVTFDTDKEGVIYFYRPARFAGGGTRVKLVVNKEFIGKLANNGYGYMVLEPGKYEVAVKWDILFEDANTRLPTVQVTVHPVSGGIVYLQVTGHSDAYGGVWAEVKSVGKLIGEKEIKEMKFDFGIPEHSHNEQIPTSD